MLCGHRVLGGHDHDARRRFVSGWILLRTRHGQGHLLCGHRVLGGHDHDARRRLVFSWLLLRAGRGQGRLRGWLPLSEWCNECRSVSCWVVLRHAGSQQCVRGGNRVYFGCHIVLTMPCEYVCAWQCDRVHCVRQWDHLG